MRDYALEEETVCVRRLRRLVAFENFGLLRLSYVVSGLRACYSESEVDIMNEWDGSVALDRDNR